jgi:hypothetical protein
MGNAVLFLVPLPVNNWNMRRFLKCKWCPFTSTEMAVAYTGKLCMLFLEEKMVLY